MTRVFGKVQEQVELQCSEIQLLALELNLALDREYLQLAIAQRSCHRLLLGLGFFFGLLIGVVVCQTQQLGPP